MSTVAGLALVAALFGSVASATPALAQASATAQVYAIPASDLGRALTLLADQADLTLLYPSTIVSGRTTADLSGSYTPTQALSALLSGSGLVHRFTATDSVTIEDPTIAAALPDDGAIILDQIDVTAWVDGAATGQGFQGTPDWVYEASESVSVVSREAIRNTVSRDTRDLTATVSGVYSGEGNGSFPTVSPNIRGLQDSGRIVVSIDGARQNAQRGFGTGSSGYQSNSGQAFVDSAFIRMVEIDKNPGASSGNAGSLGGSVNYRTVGADDIISEGTEYGVEANFTRGDNEYDLQGSVLMAARLPNTPFAVTAGISRLDLGQYKVGQYNPSNQASSGSFKGRNGFSSLLKLEGDFGDVRTTLSWVHQQNAFRYGSDIYSTREHVTNDSVTAELAWDPVDNEFIDLKASLWLNNSRTDELRETRILEGVLVTPDTYIDLDLLSFGGTLENTSRFETPVGPASLHYGIEAFHDASTSSATSATIASNPTWASSYTAFSPAGNRDMASLFVNGEIEPTDWFKFSGGVRYDWYRLHGTSTYYNRTERFVDTTRRAGAVTTYRLYLQANNPVLHATLTNLCDNLNIVGICLSLAQTGEIVNTGGPILAWFTTGQTIPGVTYNEVLYPAHEVGIDRSGGAWLPSITAEFTPTDWFRPYVSYSQTFRPPTILETFFAGGAPTDGTGITYAPNPALRPETATTWEIGANISANNLLLENDSLRVKVAAFHRQINDYIVLGSILTAAEPGRTYTGFVNAAGSTTMRGLEIEGNYDARSFWIGGSASLLETAWPQGTEIFSNGTITTSGDIFAVAGNVPPRLKVTLDAGIRLLEEKLSLGARINHAQPSLSRELDKNGELKELTKEYTTLDLYGSYAISDNAAMRFAINNVTDLNYIPATGGYTAPGRTILATLNLKF